MQSIEGKERFKSRASDTNSWAQCSKTRQGPCKALFTHEGYSFQSRRSELVSEIEDKVAWFTTLLVPRMNVVKVSENWRVVVVVAVRSVFSVVKMGE